MQEPARVKERNGSCRREYSRLERIPWLALGSLLVVLVCLGASISVIVASDSQIVDSWKVQPAVLLSILTSVSNSALGIAFSSAVVVTWWTSAVDGASLAQLHYIWDRGEGMSFFSALAAGANARRVVLTASVVVMVKIATNPLLQRATHQRIDQVMTQDVIRLNLAQYIPEDWTGTNSPQSKVALSIAASAVLQDSFNNATIRSLDAPGYYCDGTCQGNVPGAGIFYSCSSTTESLDLLVAVNGTLIFAINTTMLQNSTGAPFILLTTVHPSAIDDACTATLTVNACKIETGVIEYPVILRNSTITLDSDELNRDVTILSPYVYPGDLSTVSNGSSPGPLHILNDFLGNFLNSSAVVDSAKGYTTETMIADMFYQVAPSNYDDFTYTHCSLKWSSPTNYVLNVMQNFMFRAALRASNGTHVQTFTAQRTKSTLVFHSVYGYLAAASAITLLVLIIILIMLQGWWVLGRTATLSPLETAKAFCAPLIECDGYDATVDTTLRKIGGTRVKYIDGSMKIYNDNGTTRLVNENDIGA